MDTTPPDGLPRYRVLTGEDDAATRSTDAGEDGDVRVSIAPVKETGWPAMPATARNFQRSPPVGASTALNQPSIVP